MLNARCIGCFAAGLLLAISLVAQPKPLVPEVSALQSGDLLWPKKPGKFVPYDSTTQEDFEAQRQKWLTEKVAYIQRVRNSPTPGLHALQWATDLEQMTFEDFVRIYEGDHDENYVVKYGGQSPLYVGHVAIVLVENGTPHVVEAVMGKGVIRSTYAEWLAGRPGELVWHGRVKGVNEQQKMNIAATAVSFLGRPYSFWNFNLGDDTVFYCSKLVWLSVQRAAAITLDDDPAAERYIWYSPKRLMKSPHVELLLTHGDYAID
jgi:cell wall-associated NlpC family hydrolase